ncbi:MAG: Monooxygenase, flavin-binding family [uncultured Sphingomonadaceae bacterium]|uniref:Monooxygenase, flavin-binding family n=1 Tax=uncultured Sphingomonadaceae bacterium TaxID=169976 RepID=A0A6J4SMB6_9SPHN|nr:MAG: Monooxygenase, flavin-binding family [uncultured Sphingomonadaceae bacterium]
MQSERRPEQLDVLVVGAGLSGIGAGYYLKQRCPDRSFAILEAREAIGGTWDLFRYPGIRSDSDMHTLGYAFKPWTKAKAIADGPSIRDYIRETAAEYNILPHIRFRHRLVRADWSSADARWTVTVETDEGERELSCRFLFMCSGYYDYAQGHLPDFPGAGDFRGEVIHPQFWPEDHDYSGRRVVVIGSGATAVTLVPEMAKHAAHVTMLQRSPTYIVARPAEDAVANWLRRRLPGRLAYRLTRWKNVLLGLAFYQLARRRPGKVRENILKGVREHLGPDHDVDTHFTPSYNPWDQRLCLVPDADLFGAIKNGSASVVTDHIERFTPDGIRLKSGKELPADVIVAATGLKLQLLAGVRFSLDGRPVKLPDQLMYKGMMFSDVPNLAFCFGYTNASWTLKSDLTCEYVCRLLNHMGKRGLDLCVPRRDPDAGETPFVDFSSGYIQRALAELPKQGAKKPWRLNQNYALDLVSLRYGRVDDGTMAFGRAAGAKAERVLEPAS